MRLPVSTTLSSSLFTHNLTDKVLVCEASELGGGKFSPLYDDACDIGLDLRNEKTGNITTWSFSRDVYDADGDLMHTELSPIFESVRRNPALQGYKMIILND